MSLSIIDDLYPASYNGVGFLIESSTVAGGRKTVTHEFPNQDNRYVEDLGLLNETITIRGCVATESYFGDRDALKFAFETPGYGTLIHPFHGIRRCACTTYSIDERTDSLGHLNFSATFLVAQELNFPAGGAQTFQSVVGLANVMIGLLHSYYSSSNSTGLGRGYSVIGRTMKALTDTFKATSSNYITRSEFISDTTAEFKVALDRFNTLSPSLAANPQSFLDSIAPVYKTIDAITSDGRAGFSLAQGLLDLTIPPIRITPVTPHQLAVVAQQDLTVNFSRVYAFALMANNASLIKFTTLNEYLTTDQALNDLYADLRTNLALDPAASPVSTALEDLWANTSKLLAQQVAGLPLVSLVQGRDLPVTILTYNYYGSLDKVTAIQELNFPTHVDPSLLFGEVKILSGI